MGLGAFERLIWGKAQVWGLTLAENEVPHAEAEAKKDLPVLRLPDTDQLAPSLGC